MKMIARNLLAVLLLGVASGSAAQAPNRWIEVDGGSWVVDNLTMLRLQQQIQEFVTAATRAEGRELQDWATYNFQYRASEELGKPFVFVNAFCVDDGFQDLDKQLFRFTDGGTCFFSVKYDPENDLFFDLLVNGDG